MTTGSPKLEGMPAPARELGRCRRLLDELHLIAERMARASHLLVGLDFDGTLAPLVDHPAQATLAPETRALLATLAARPGTDVAVISGRRLDDVRARVGLEQLFFAGNHGLEICGPGLRFVEANAVQARSTLDSLAIRLSGRLAHIAGAVVEHKRLTISVHYRLVPPGQVDEVHRHVEAALAVTTDCFHVCRGAKVLEVRPNVDWHKGSALHWIAQQLGKQGTLTLYLGDDRTDEDAFAVLADGISVKVGEASGTSAQYHLGCPSDVRRFLQWATEIPHDHQRA